MINSEGSSPIAHGLGAVEHGNGLEAGVIADFRPFPGVDNVAKTGVDGLVFPWRPVQKQALGMHLAPRPAGVEDGQCRGQEGFQGLPGFGDLLGEDFTAQNIPPFKCELKFCHSRLPHVFIPCGRHH